jgi:hypothetical protein
MDGWVDRWRADRGSGRGCDDGGIHRGLEREKEGAEVERVGDRGGTWATARALCWVPVATHSTSMLYTGWPGGSCTITGGGGPRICGATREQQ